MPLIMRFHPCQSNNEIYNLNDYMFLNNVFLNPIRFLSKEPFLFWGRRDGLCKIFSGHLIELW